MIHGVGHIQSIRVLVGLVTMLMAGTSVPADGAGANSENHPRKARGQKLFGTLQSKASRAAKEHALGVDLVTIDVPWSEFEPQEGQFDQARLDKLHQRIKAFADAGMKVVIGVGFQYAPDWIFDYPNSDFMNQYGEAYHNDSPGADSVNAVFNQVMRDKQAAFVGKICEEVGDEVYGIRLGWGYYGEIGYPHSQYKAKDNCYWAFGPIAQGRVKGLPPTLDPCPVPGWKPGQAGSKHKTAKRFIDWYLAALVDYQAWQIKIVRQHFAGRLIMLYPSWGVRPGRLHDAVQADLAGQTAAEKTGEIPRGLDFARLVAHIKDRGVVVCTTWIDSNPSFGNDRGDKPAAWSPAHYLAHLAHHHPLDLEVWGENTGSAQVSDMRLSFKRLKAYRIRALVWAFEPQLYDGTHASIDDYARFIRNQSPPMK